MNILEAFVSTTLTEVLLGATDAELKSIVETAAGEAEVQQACILLNNAAFTWLEHARKTTRVGHTDATLRQHKLNAFFLVNFNI